jgi:hypothetical protein
MTINVTNRHAIVAGVLVVALILGVWVLSRDTRDPEWLRQQYGIENAFSQRIETPEGDSLTASLVPVTLADGKTAYLVVPQKGSQQLYLKDDSGLAPVQATDGGADKEQFVRSRPVIVERPVATAPAAPRTQVEPKKKRSTSKEVMIVAGSAGAGAAIGGIAGGKKGAAIGAVSGGVAGLVYDLATRDN